MQLFGDTFGDALSWTTSFSRTRFVSTDSLSLLSNASFATISDLQGILGVVQTLKLKQIPYNTLKEISFIGEGHTFAVIKHQWNDRIVAVKHIKRQILDDDGDVSVSRRRLQSVLQEILIMNHGPVMRHPNVVDLIGYGWQLNNRMPLPYVVVSYGSLGSLRPYLISKAPSSLKHKAMLAGDVAAGLLILHQSGIVHGDLKLDNVVVYPSRDREFGVIAKICDFGHSITLSAAERPLLYHGTPLYTPPEALDQINNPILAKDLHKCDIWAFGLCLWEIIIDGNLYFHRSWRSDTSFSRDTLVTTNDSTNSMAPYFNTPSSIMTPGTTVTSTGVTNIDAFDDDERTTDLCFGRFDLGHLQVLAHKALIQVCPRQTWERTYLAPLLRSSLSIDPSKRLSELNRSPLMSAWHKTNPEMALQTQLAVHTSGGNSRGTYDLFRPDRQTEIPWEYQEHIKRDLENIAESKTESEKLGAAAFQLMACHALGFGCDVDLGKALQSLKTAVNHGLAIAHLLSDTLTDALESSSSAETEPYTDKVARAFAVQRSLNKKSRLYLCRLDDAGHDDGRPDLGAIAATNPAAILQTAILVSHQSKKVVLSTTYLFSSIDSSYLSWLELAILMDDMALLQLSCDSSALSNQGKTGLWEETPLILACRRGKSNMVRALLRAGHSPKKSVNGGCNLFHWLFCLGEDAIDILDCAVKVLGQDPELVNTINETCTSVHSLDHQWPTEFTGTPLAFAVTSGHRSLVKALLKLGANPLTTVYCPPTTSGLNPSWTPMHLAVKYNFSKILEDLRDYTIAHQSKQRTVDSIFGRPSRHLADEILMFPDFQLGAALSYITPLERFAIHGRSSPSRLRATIAALPERALFWASNHGTTPIWQAIDFENAEVVEALLDAAPELAKTEIQDPDRDASRMLPLHFAAQICAHRGSSDALRIPRLILDAHKSACILPDGDGRTPLHLSVSTNFSFVTEWLIKMGCQINATDTLGRTPLMLCRSAANTRMLLQHGADISQLDTEGVNSAHHAVARGVDASLSLLIDRGIDLDSSGQACGTALHIAVAGSSVACVEQLCEANVSINVLDPHGDTPLNVAVAAKRSDNVEVLVRYGADVTIPNAAGLRPTTIVIKQIGLQKPIECPDELRTFQALINLTPTPDNVPRFHPVLLDALHDIAKVNNPTLMKLFLSLPHVSKRIKIDSLKDGKTPLHSAAEFHAIETARFLLDKGAIPNQTDDEGSTPLMTLCSSTCKEVNKLDFADLLLSLRPCLTIFNNMGKSAWSIAQEKGDYMIMCRLLEHIPDEGIDTMLRDAPITWHVLDLALSQRQTKFVLACLRKAAHISCFADPNVLRDISRAMGCDADRASIVSVFNIILEAHRPDVVRDALNGEPVAAWWQYHFRSSIEPDENAYSSLQDQLDHGSGRVPLQVETSATTEIAEFWSDWESWADRHRAAKNEPEIANEVKTTVEQSRPKSEVGEMACQNQNDCEEELELRSEEVRREEEEDQKAVKKTVDHGDDDENHDLYD